MFISFIQRFTSIWSFPTLNVNLTLPWFVIAVSCSMSSKVEWSKKTSGFCFAELTKSSVSVNEILKQ